MRRRLRACVVGGAVLLGPIAAVACRDGTGPATERTPTFTGRWDGRPWAGDASALLIPRDAGGDTLYVFGSHPGGAPPGWVEQYIRVRAVVSAPGSYVLDDDAVEVVNLVGGDGVTARYVGDGSAGGMLHITTFGGSGGIVEGRLEFEARATGSYMPYGPDARFEGGWFRATIERRR